MADSEKGMADYFLQGFGSMLPDNHPARADLMQAPYLGKEKHTGLVAYELTELAVDWLQELVGEEGGDKKLLDNLPAPNVDLKGRRRRILHVGGGRPTVAGGRRPRPQSAGTVLGGSPFSRGRTSGRVLLCLARRPRVDGRRTRYRGNASSREAQRTRQSA